MTPITNPHELCRILNLPETLAQNALTAHGEYSLRVPEEFVRKMEKGNSRDPLLLQIFPQAQEQDQIEGFTNDPLQEHVTKIIWPCCNGFQTSRLMQKYENRVLFLATEECAVHCRYCFRRKMKTETNSHPVYEKTDIFPQVPEIILSGGDPLCLPDEQLEDLLYKISRIPIVRRIRIHTRYPVVDPNRFTQNLLRILKSDKKTVFSLVLHVNHPREIDTTFEDAVLEAIDRGIPIFSQSVLLRGVNDSPVTLFELYEKLISLRIHPYYLHQLDRVSGTAHFEVSPQKGLELMNSLRRTLPGYAVPKYVREVPGEASKVEMYDY